MAMMAASPVLALANLGVGGICWWGSVALVGAGRDFTPAWRIFCYAQAGMVLGLIPFFGMLVAGIWILALMYCGVKEVYGISAGGSLGALAIFLTFQAVAGADPFTGPGGRPGRPGIPAAAGLKRLGAAWASRRFRLILKPWATQPITASHRQAEVDQKIGGQFPQLKFKEFDRRRRLGVFQGKIHQHDGQDDQQHQFELTHGRLAFGVTLSGSVSPRP